MREKHLSICLRVSLVLTILCAVVLMSGLVTDPVLKRYVDLFCITSIVVTFFAFLSTLMSSLLLSVFKGNGLYGGGLIWQNSIKFLKWNFFSGYIFFTKEARNEWREYLAEIKAKALQQESIQKSDFNQGEK